jgi:hypothetical protein
MLNIFRRIGVVTTLVVLSLVVLMTLFLFYSEVGMAKEIGIQEIGSPTYDASQVALAGEFIGRSQEKVTEFTDQLVATYMEVKDSDIVIFFNSGGWGWNLTEETPGWSSILTGIKTELEKLGYTSITLNYRRTNSGVRGCVREFIEAARHYPNRAEDLAARVEFLTNHLPETRVIVAGESTGTVITDQTMKLLKDNDQVYSIQTGTPFWHTSDVSERILLMNTNGKSVDTFSGGNIPVMIWTSIKHWLGISSPDQEPGDILSWLKAPGHDYSWQYPGVYTQVVEFLDTQFGPKS